MATEFVTIPDFGLAFEMVNYMFTAVPDTEAKLRAFCRDHAALLRLVPEWNGECADDSPDDVPLAQVSLGVLLALRLRDHFLPPARSAVCQDKELLEMSDAVSVACGGRGLLVRSEDLPEHCQRPPHATLLDLLLWGIEGVEAVELQRKIDRVDRTMF